MLPLFFCLANYAQQALTHSGLLYDKEITFLCLNLYAITS